LINNGLAISKSSVGNFLDSETPQPYLIDDGETVSETWTTLNMATGTVVITRLSAIIATVLAKSLSFLLSWMGYAVG
jgi:hypothetical protein